MAYSILPPPSKSTHKLIQKRRSKKRKVKILGALVTAGFIFFIFSIIGVAIAFGYFARDLPSPNKLTDRSTSQSTEILDRNGNLLYRVFGDKNRILVKLDKIPDHLEKATIAIEDKNFYKHKGFDWQGMLRSVREIVFEKQLQGGSTITQQLVKKALLSDERTVTRKVKEVILAIQIERRYSKEEILQIYLNEIPYGGTAWGVEAASQQYFGKPVANLNLTESAILAGLPQLPSAYSPFGPDPKAYIGRTSAVLRRMREDKYISKAQEEASLKELPTVKFAEFGKGIKAPHFSIYIKKLLEEKYGEQMVLQGGLRVQTTLDLTMQEMAQKAVQDQINSEQNRRLKVSNGAAVIQDTKTGEILALVGSKDYFAKDIPGNFDVATQGVRQPGSALKPFTYLTGFKKGFNPATMWIDEKVDFGGGYEPGNYNDRFQGPTLTRPALGNSRNITAVKQLAVTGVPELLTTLKDFGITTLNDPDKYGLALTLGGGAVNLLELNNAYSILGNTGKHHPTIAILKVTDASGKVLEEYKPKDGRQVVAAEKAYLVNHILADKNAKQNYGSYWANRLNFRADIGVKTGTSEFKTDNWTFGYTPVYSLGTWVGNNDNTPMHPSLASGVTGAAPIYRTIMEQLLKDKPVTPFPRPEGIVQMEIDTTTGQKASSFSGGRKQEVFEKGNLPPENDMYVKVRVCKPSGLLASAACEEAGEAEDRVFLVMYDPYTKQKQNGRTVCNPCPPTATDTSFFDSDENKPKVEITDPEDGDTNVNKTFTARARVTGTPNNIVEVRYTLNPGNQVKFGSKSGSTYNTSYTVLNNGVYTLTARALDDAGNFGDTTISFTVGPPGGGFGSPIVLITSPDSGASVGTSFLASADVVEAGGKIRNVSFSLSGPTSLSGNDNSEPYALQFSNIQVGKYLLTVTATDQRGRTGSSTSNFTVQ